jgi:hypothetical protein
MNGTISWMRVTDYSVSDFDYSFILCCTVIEKNGIGMFFKVTLLNFDN